MERGQAKLDRCIRVLVAAADLWNPRIELISRATAENLERWNDKECNPTAKTAPLVAEEIWKHFLRAENSQKQLKKFHKLLKKHLPELGEGATMEEFSDVLEELVKSGRAEMRADRRLAKIQTKFESAKSLDAVVASVDRIFHEAGIKVTDRVAHVNPAVKVELTPLYAYVASLQKSAEIPSYFPGVPSIRLDELYVELCAAENQRGIAPDNPNARTWQDADKARPEHLALWRLATARRRVPLPTLLSRTELKPAVVFGDPGSGKSCLTRYTLHELGRGLLDPQRGLSLRALPFRISLRDFVKDGQEDRYSILKYLVRHELKVEPKLAGDWLTLLAHLFTDRKPARLFILIDGIDEATPSAEEYQQIQRQLEETTSIARMIFTSRRAGFLPPVQSYGAFELIELSEASIHAMIRNWYRVVHPRSDSFVQSFSSWVFANPRQQDMAGNPCLLGLLCFLNQDRTDGDFLAAKSRAQLYRLAVERFIASCGGEFEEQSEALIQVLAAFALDRYRVEDDQKAPLVLFNSEELRIFLGRWRQNAQAPGRDIPIRTLLRFWRATRLVTQWDLSGWHCFLHHTFQEYFAALALNELPEEETLALIDRARFNPYWREVWRFYAGLCQNDARSGGKRFRTLVRSFVQPEDLYGETLLLVAPLCAEFGLSDTSPVLGFDLRERLHANLLRRHRRSMDLIQMYRADRAPEGFFQFQEDRTNEDPQIVARVRVMADLDPLYFFQHARSRLDLGLHRGRRSTHENATSNQPDREELVLAALILSCIYHPQALAYQMELIRQEALDPMTRASDPPVGPRTPTGRNERLCREISALFPQAAGWLQRGRLVDYLANTRSPDAGTALLAIARQSFPKRAAADAMALRVRCLAALCELQDPRAVDLARELCGEPDFRRKHVEAACEYLATLKVPSAAELLEEWLVDRVLQPDTIAHLSLISALKEWPEREMPAGAEKELRSSQTKLTLKLKLWELFLARTGEQGRVELRQRFNEALTRPRLTAAEWHELAALAQLAAAERLDLMHEIQALAEKAPSQFPLERQRLWGSVVELYAAQAHLPEQAKWLEDVGLPKMLKEATKPSRGQGEIRRAWIESLALCPPRVLARLAQILDTQADRLDDSRLGEFLQAFSGRASLIPARLLNRAESSDDDELNRVAREAYLDLDPGRLVSRRESDASIDEMLEETSANTGVLFFADRLYSPSLSEFVPYKRNEPG